MTQDHIETSSYIEYIVRTRGLTYRLGVSKFGECRDTRCSIAGVIRDLAYTQEVSQRSFRQSILINTATATERDVRRKDLEFLLCVEAGVCF